MTTTTIYFDKSQPTQQLSQILNTFPHRCQNKLPDILYYLKLDDFQNTLLHHIYAQSDDVDDNQMNLQIIREISKIQNNLLAQQNAQHEQVSLNILIDFAGNQTIVKTNYTVSGDLQLLDTLQIDFKRIPEFFKHLQVFKLFKQENVQINDQTQGAIYQLSKQQLNDAQLEKTQQNRDLQFINQKFIKELIDIANYAYNYQLIVLQSCFKNSVQYNNIVFQHLKQQLDFLSPCPNLSAKSSRQEFELVQNIVIKNEITQYDLHQQTDTQAKQQYLKHNRNECQNTYILEKEFVSQLQCSVEILQQ